jgi:hypothetical protein
MLYDMIVFTTLPLSDHHTKVLTDIVHPANLQIVTDELTLTDQLNQMTRMQKMILKRRCNVNATDQLFWWTRCCEDGATGACMSLAYTWQSEFRAKHLWSHPAIAPYQTMMWFDSDAMATRVWTHDPVAVHRRNALKILFANFPQGKSAGVDLMEKIHFAFPHDDNLCLLKLKHGHLYTQGGECTKPAIPNIHGFFHITDLTFYRQPEILEWFDILIGDAKFSRRWDDQLAVTIPSAIKAPELSYEMQALGVVNDVWHNQYLDGKVRYVEDVIVVVAGVFGCVPCCNVGSICISVCLSHFVGNHENNVFFFFLLSFLVHTYCTYVYRWRGGGYQKWWAINGNTSFPEAAEKCQGLITNAG